MKPQGHFILVCESYPTKIQASLSFVSVTFPSLMHLQKVSVTLIVGVLDRSGDASRRF
jgi:hypothetical protein